jgi:N-acetylneuraminate lyase
MKTTLTGLIAAPFTALREDGSLHVAMIGRQAQALAANGVTGAFVCGTTGEGLSLTTAERRQVAEEWLATAPRALRVIVHVGHPSVAESRQLAAHAAQIGAYAFAALAPTFFRAADLEQLVDCCAQVASGAPALPFFYYHLPAITGANFSMYDFLERAAERIPNLAGIKFTHEDLMDYRRCVTYADGRFNILFGRDEMLLAALALGGTGAVGSTYNYLAPVFHQILAAVEAGDFATARQYQSQAIEIIALMIQRGGLPAGKAMMKLVGLDCGPVRAPLRNLSPETWAQLTHELEAVGFPACVQADAPTVFPKKAG